MRRRPWPPQFWADQLTLSRPGGGTLSPPSTTSPPPDFQTLRRPCYTIRINTSRIRPQAFVCCFLFFTENKTETSSRNECAQLLFWSMTIDSFACCLTFAGIVLHQLLGGVKLKLNRGGECKVKFSQDIQNNSKWI